MSPALMKRRPSKLSASPTRPGTKRGWPSSSVRFTGKVISGNVVFARKPAVTDGETVIGSPV